MSMHAENQPPTVIVDYDGLLTNSEEMLPRYQDKALDEFEIIFGPSRNVIEPLLLAENEKILQHPNEHPFILQERFISYSSDHMITTCIGFLNILDTLSREDEHHGLRIPRESWHENLTHVYEAAYQHTGVIYRAEAKEVLIEAHKRRREFTIAIVSGTKSEYIRPQLQTLFSGTSIDAGDLLVFGNAKKSEYIITEPDLEESFQPDGYSHVIYARRPNVKKIMSQLTTALAATGDTLPSDLAYFEKIKVFTMLLETMFTTQAEKNYYLHHPNGKLIKTLDEVLIEVNRLLIEYNLRRHSK